MKSFRPKDHPDDHDDGAGRNAERGFHRQKRSNDTHASTTDPDARLCKKADGQASRLCFVGTALMENRNGLVVDGRLTRASGISESLSAADVVAERRERRITSRRTPTTLAQVDQGGEAAIQHRRADTPAMPPAKNAVSASRRSSPAMVS